MSDRNLPNLLVAESSKLKAIITKLAVNQEWSVATGVAGAINYILYDTHDIEAVFPIIIVGLIIVDTLTGLIKSWKEGVFESYKMNNLLVKVIVTFFFLVPIWLCSKLISSPEWVNTFFSILNIFAFMFVAIKEIVSNIENLYEIAPKHIPIWLVAKLKVFRDTGKTENLNQDTPNDPN